MDKKNITILLIVIFGLIAVYFLKSFMLLLLVVGGGLIGLIVLHFLNNKKTDNKSLKCCDAFAGIHCDENTKNCDDPECLDDEKCGKRTCRKECDIGSSGCVKCSDSEWCRKHQTKQCN